MDLYKAAPEPASLLGYHRILSPTASVKVSPICLGGISIGLPWSPLYGRNADAAELLDAYFALGGNFIDTANIYKSGDSERLIGEWLESRGNRDQMVIATKYSAGYRAHNRANEPLQSNFTGNSAKSMHVSVRDSLKKLRTDYIDILYVHWWDFATSVEEMMRHLHALVMARQVLYLGISDTPAWFVVKANAFARYNGLTPFSLYQGKWNAGFRDMEAEIIPMCEDQGMAIVPWGTLGGGNLRSAGHTQADESTAEPLKYESRTQKDVQVSAALDKIAQKKGTTLQAVALAYLFQQSTYVIPIVGVETVQHVEAMSEALRIKLTAEEIDTIHEASPFKPLFPMDFMFVFRGDQKYSLSLTAANNQQYEAAARFDAPPKQPPYEPHAFI